ncbi:MAG TPA: SDR family oxidoreductase [Dinghuibacter sp.]|jgi:NAD(P)-dependent dehydrogenase (short-subunit alcohol dehydrogenase family)|uniref:SDR family oxidoreductase n=1 Tax=Dinghuibacter sp. TaxID=2024697 RepID=UPI002C3C59EE|nr:SDR family oxidoreductase [Dinghuibacter sp.]HTJ14770.1 SDR family oxidoreductase [Dinghuibacter sp.]
MKTIFITGASSGLGRASVDLFAQKGWNVIATMRNPQKIDNVTVLPLDVTDPKQIDEAVKNAGKVDVVFNNAGYGLMGPLEGTTDEQIRREIDTNLLGVIRVMKAFIPHFRENKGGLFITTTSIGGLFAVPYASIYHATKWALEGFSESMAFELATLGIGVKTVSPGGIATDFGGRSMDMARHEAYAESFDGMLGRIFKEDGAFHFSTAEAIANVVYEAATDGKDQLRYVAGPDAQALYARRLEIGAEASRKEIARTMLG